MARISACISPQPGDVLHVSDNPARDFFTVFCDERMAATITIGDEAHAAAEALAHAILDTIAARRKRKSAQSDEASQEHVVAEPVL